MARFVVSCAVEALAEGICSVIKLLCPRRIIIGGGVSMIGEELFFRLAVQDAFGLPGSVAAYVLVNSSVGGVRWLPYLLVHAAVLGLLVQQGFGLLGSTVANAIMNHLNLWRLRCR